jgi:KAP family P-loop domain
MTHADIPLIFADPAADWLDRGPAVQALRRLLDSPALATPLVVGVYGGWGTGKTSVMQTLEASLTAPQRLILWFDAWVYARQEQALWRALLLRVVEALRERTLTPEDRNLLGAEYDTAKKEFDALWITPKDAEDARKELEEARSSLYRSLTVKEQGGIRVNWWGALPLAADAALTALTAGSTERWRTRSREKTLREGSLRRSRSGSKVRTRRKRSNSSSEKQASAMSTNSPF